MGNQTLDHHLYPEHLKFLKRLFLKNLIKTSNFHIKFMEQQQNYYKDRFKNMRIETDIKLDYQDVLLKLQKGQNYSRKKC